VLLMEVARPIDFQSEQRNAVGSTQLLVLGVHPHPRTESF
jgi:hypothetical protein